MDIEGIDAEIRSLVDTCCTDEALARCSALLGALPLGEQLKFQSELVRAYALRDFLRLVIAHKADRPRGDEETIRAAGKLINVNSARSRPKAVRLDEAAADLKLSGRSLRRNYNIDPLVVSLRDALVAFCQCDTAMREFERRLSSILSPRKSSATRSLGADIFEDTQKAPPATINEQSHANVLQRLSPGTHKFDAELQSLIVALVSDFQAGLTRIAQHRLNAVGAPISNIGGTLISKAVIAQRAPQGDLAQRREDTRYGSYSGHPGPFFDYHQAMNLPRCAPVN